MILAGEKEMEYLNEVYERLEETNQGIPPEEGTIGDLTDKFNKLQTEYNDFKTAIIETINNNGGSVEQNSTASEVTSATEEIANQSQGNAIIKTCIDTRSVNAGGTSGSWQTREYTIDVTDYEGYENFTLQNFGTELYTASTGNVTNCPQITPKSYDNTTGILTIYVYAWTVNAGPTFNVKTYLYSIGE